jgi:threonine dehydrogenase-like Zn-dependent dehydrogenase
MTLTHEKMAALVFDGSLHLETCATPIPKENEALIRVRMAGICNTDVEIVRGYMNFQGILGHEFVGEVVSSDRKEWVRKRVVGEINLGCGHCQWCLEGLSRHCPNRTVLGISGKDGAFAEYLTLPLGNLHEVPDPITDARAVFTEPLAAALEILEQVHLQPDWRVLVVGDGKLAILVARVLLRSGIDISVVGMNSQKLGLFRKSGATVYLLPDNPGSGYDLVVEASGSPEGWEKAISAVRPRGTVVLKSTYHGNLNWNTAPLVINEITVVGSRCGLFPPALRLLADPSFETNDLIEAIFPLHSAVAAFERSRSPEAMKVLMGIAPPDEFSGISTGDIDNLFGEEA